MTSSICWGMNFQDSGMSVRSIEVDFKDCGINHWQCLMLGDNEKFHDEPLGSTWKNKLFCGSKKIALKVTTFGFEKATLMRAKLADAGNGTRLRMVVKLQGKQNNNII